MNRRRVLVILAIIVALATAGAYWYLAGSGREVPGIGVPLVGPDVPAPPEPAAATLRLLGTIEVDEVLVSTELAGRVVAMEAEEADTVSAGEVLAWLDTALIEAQILQARAAIQSAEAQAALAKAGLRTEEIAVAEAALAKAQEDLASATKAVEVAQGSVATAKALLRVAGAQQARVRAGVNPYDITLAQEQAQLAKDRIASQARIRDSAGGLEQQGILPSGSYEVGQAAVAQANVQAEIAQLQVDALEAGARVEDLQAAQAAVEAAQAGVKAAEAQVVQAEQRQEAAEALVDQAEAQLALLRGGATDEEIAVAEAPVKAAKAALGVLEVRHRQGTVTAPMEGLIVERAVHVGEQVLPGSVLYRLANLDQVRVIVFVPEVEVGRLALGQTVDVYVSALPERSFEGQISHISSRAEFTPRNVPSSSQGSAEVFAVRVVIDNPDQALKPGMPAEVELP